MALAHRAFRKGFRELAGLFRSVKAGDAKQSTLVGEHVDFMLTALHHHHAAEDELLWPKLHARAPRQEAEIERMEHQHSGIAASADKLRRLLSVWRLSAEPGLAGQLAAGAEQLSGRIDEHLVDEEQHIVPLINDYLTQLEWQECLDRWASILFASKLKYGLMLGGLILDNASSEEQRRFLAGVPLMPRMLLKLFAIRTYASYSAALHGARK
jgi:hemerythrin-like domain-containing protein